MPVPCCDSRDVIGQSVPPGEPAVGAQPGPPAESRQEPTRWTSFEEFYRGEYHKVVVLARVLTGDASAAEDLAHDAFTAAVKEWDRLDNPPAWVRRVVTNKAGSHWRRRYAERRAITTLAAQIPSAHEMPADTEAFWAQVRSLPTRQAQAVTLFYLEDLTTAEIALVLGCAPATVRVHLTRGRRSLARQLEVSDV